NLITELRSNVSEVVSVIELTNSSVESGVKSTTETLASLRAIEGQSSNLGTSLDQLHLASGELAELVASVRQASGQCVDSVENMTASVRGVVDSVQIGSSVSEQGAAAAEELLASTMETGRAAQALSDLAEEMRQSVAMFVVAESPALEGQARRAA
ncbi:MAG: hypothetical protein JSS65_03675, partial [Armatimonadetes bacterium]|nr:hypothetical protein [Armatimonadota bacterium]